MFSLINCPFSREKKNLIKLNGNVRVRLDWTRMQVLKFPHCHGHFFKMNLGLRAPSSQSLNLPNTTFPKRLFTWAGLAGYLDTGRNSSQPNWLVCHVITKLIFMAFNSRAAVLVKWYAHWCTHSLWMLCWNWGDVTRDYLRFLGQNMLARCRNNSK